MEEFLKELAAADGQEALLDLCRRCSLHGTSLGQSRVCFGNIVAKMSKLGPIESFLQRTFGLRLRGLFTAIDRTSVGDLIAAWRCG